ncbi:MAG: hypothetical protein CL908_13860 [Deltaproteobacteria bacterium]|nr:hypothetical protein [Deltaproteobacteria bacterium]
MRFGIRRGAVVLFVALALLTPARSGRAVDLDGVAAKSVDVILLRPLGTFQLIAGAVLMAPASLLNALMFPINRDKTVFEEDFDRYLVAPFEFAFTRPLGKDLAGE